MSDLSRNQRRALAALLECSTITGAAAACELSEKTISRYLALPEFRAALRAAEGDLIDGAGRRLVNGQDKAIQALDSMIDDPEASASNRRLAAVAWLDYVFRYRELVNLETRLNELEAAVYGNENDS